MSSKSRYRGKRRRQQAGPVDAPRRPAPPVHREPPELEAVRAALRRLGGRAVVKVLPDLDGRAKPIVTFADPTAKVEFERALAEELGARGIGAIQEAGRVA